MVEVLVGQFPNLVHASECELNGTPRNAFEVAAEVTHRGVNSSGQLLEVHQNISLQCVMMDVSTRVASSALIACMAEGFKLDAYLGLPLHSNLTLIWIHNGGSATQFPTDSQQVVNKSDSSTGSLEMTEITFEVLVSAEDVEGFTHEAYKRIYS